jgi:hypothetical protein
MSELPDLDDAMFKLATGEEFVVPADAPPGAASASPRGGVPQQGVPAGLRPVGPRPVARPTWLDKRTAGRLRARKVRRLVRHIEPWSVLKVALIFYFCLWVILLIAGVMLWSLAVSSGTVDNVETFVTELFALESFTFNADQIFRASAIGGLVLVVAGAGFTVLMAALFNLISDVTGGVRFTVVEEETARPRPKRLRPRRGMLDRVVGAGQPRPGVVPAPALAGEPRGETAESAPGEGAPAADFAPESSATDEHLPTPADAESGADPEIDGPDEGVVNGDDDR